MSTRFNEPMGIKPVTKSSPLPTAEQIAATGAAMPAGAHQLSSAQQRAWFGSIVFDAPVTWDGKTFVSGDRRLTPQQVARGGQ